MGDVNQRLVVYKRLASCVNDREVGEIKEELTDRYGDLPVAAGNLLRVITFKNFLRQFLINSVDYNSKEVILTFHPLAKASLEKILTLIENDPGKFRFSPDLKLSFVCKARDWKEVMAEVKKTLAIIV